MKGDQMKAKISDQTLCRIFRILFSIFKKSALNGEYPIFPPEKVEIISRTAVRYEVRGTAKTLREGLKYLGATLYHLATGESEFNNESIRLDGYNTPLDSRYWPAIEHLLSAQAFSLPQVEMMFSRKYQLFNRAKTAMLTLLSGLGRASIAIIGYLIRKSLSLAGRFWDWWENDCLTLIVMVFIGLAIIFSIVQGKYFTAFGPIILFLIFILLGFVLLLLLAAISELLGRGLSKEKKDRILTILITINLPVFLSVYAFFVFCFPLKTMSAEGAYSTKQNAVMTERSTGEFIGRLPLNKSDDFLVLPEAKLWNILKTAWFFNPIKHQVVPGLPLKGEIALESKEAGSTMKIKFSCQDPQRFVAAWEKFRTEEGLKQELLEAFARIHSDLLGPAIAAIDPAEKSPEQIISSLKISLEGDLTDQQKMRINDSLIKAAAAEINNLDLERQNDRKRELNKAAQEKLSQEFAPYIDLTFI